MAASGLTRPLVALAVWAAAIAGAIALSSAVASHVHHEQAKATRKAVVKARTGHEIQGRSERPSDESTLGAVPPRPRRANRISPTSPRSLFRAQNLAIVLGVARHELGASAQVSAFALYPGEADLIVANNIFRRLVRIDDDGDLAKGRPQSFSGSIDVVYLWQIRSGVPQQLAREIARRAHVPMRRLDRMVVDLDPHHHLAGWNVYEKLSPRHFHALLTGGGLVEVRG
jgi:hypothetical protein